MVPLKKMTKQTKNKEQKVTLVVERVALFLYNDHPNLKKIHLEDALRNLRYCSTTEKIGTKRELFLTAVFFSISTSKSNRKEVFKFVFQNNIIYILTKVGS